MELRIKQSICQYYPILNWSLLESPLKKLASTENLINKFTEIKGVLKAMQDNHAQIIEYDPWDYLIKFNVNIEYNPQTREQHLNDLKVFELLMDEKVNELFQDEEKLKSLALLIERFNQPVKDFTNKMNIALKLNRKKGMEMYGSRNAYVKQLQKSEISYFEIRFLVKEIFASILNLKIEDLNDIIEWNKFELLFCLWDSYFKEKLLISSSKFHDNDYYDLLNTAYVGNDELYWTKEINPWVRLMKANPITKKYIYEYGH